MYSCSTEVIGYLGLFMLLELVTQIVLWTTVIKGLFVIRTGIRSYVEQFERVRRDVYDSNGGLNEEKGA